MDKTAKIKLFLFTIMVLVVMAVAHSSEAKSLKIGEVYRSWDGKVVFEVISENEVEVTGIAGGTIVAQYNFKNSKVRIVFNMMGTKMVEYYELTLGGLKNSNGNLYYSKSAFAEAMQKEKEAQKQKELAAKLKRKLEEQKVQIARERKLREIKTVDLNELSNADASRIVVKSIIKLRDKDGKLKVSPKGNYILYVPWDEQLGLIIEVESLKEIKSFEIMGSVNCAAWSPDGNKIVYYPGKNRSTLNMFDIDSGKTIELPILSSIFCGPEEMLWYSESEIYFYSGNGDNYCAYNLNTLETHSLIGSVPIDLIDPLDKAKQYERKKQEKKVEKQKENLRKLFSTYIHEKVYIYEKKMEGLQCLIVANKDNSFSRVLIEGLYPYGRPYEVSPQLNYVAFTASARKNDGVYIAFLGLREEPKTIFRLELDKTKQLNEDQLEKFEKYFIEGCNIVGKVYSPKFNPLNNRVVGPDRDKFKGWVKFIESYDSFSIVKTTFEIEPIKEGDIVSKIYQDSIAGRSLGIPSEVWAVLKYSNGNLRNKKDYKSQILDSNTDKSNLILGRWKDENSVMEYFKDGTFITNEDTGQKYEGTWNIEGNILRLQFINPVRALNVYTIIKMTDSTYKIKLNHADKHTSNARRIEKDSQQSNSATSGNNMKSDNPNNVLSSVFVTNTSNTYHKSKCLELMGAEGLIEFASSKKAKKAGGVPCKICNP